MCTKPRTLSLIAPRPPLVAWDIVVVVDRESRLVVHSQVICRDRETGALIAESASSQARVTIGDFV